MCKIDNTMWAFLNGIKSSGEPLSRKNLAKRCRKDLMLLSTLTTVALTAIKTGNASLQHHQRGALSAIRGAEAVLSFYTAVVVDVLHKNQSVTESKLRVLYPFLIGGLGGEVLDEEQQDDHKESHGPCTKAWKKSSCMLVSEVVRLLKLGRPLVKSLIETIASCVAQSKSIDNEFIDPDIEDLILTFTIIAQHQEVFCGSIVLRKLFLDDCNMTVSGDVLTDLETVANNYNADVSPVISSILDGAAACLHNCCVSTSSVDETFLSPKKLGTIILQVSSSGLADDKVMSQITKDILENYVTWEGTGKLVSKTNSLVANEYRVAVEDILRAISQRYPREFDEVISCIGEKYSGTTVEAKDSLGCFNDLLERVFQKTPYKLPSEIGVSLLLGLNHTSSKICSDALQKFGESVPLSECMPGEVTSDIIGLCSAAFNNFDGSADLNVLVAASHSDVLSKLVCALPVTDIFDSLGEVLASWAAKLTLFPKRGRTAFVAVLSGFYDPVVLEHVINGVPGAVDVLLLHLVFTIQLCHDALPRSEKGAKFCRAIISAVSKATSNLGQFSILLKSYSYQSFDAISDVDDICAMCWSGLSSCVAKNLTAQGEACLIALQGLNMSLLQNFENYEDYYFRFLSLIKLATSTCEELLSMQNDDMITQQTFLTCLSWVTLYYEQSRDVDRGEVISTTNLAVDNYIATILQSYRSNNNFNNSAEDYPHSHDESMEGICSCYLDNFAAVSDCKASLLICLLDMMSTDAERATTLVGLCIQAFYSFCPLRILTQIISCGDDPSDLSSPTDTSSPNSIIKNECNVTAGVRASALYTISAYLRFSFSETQTCDFSEILSLLPGTIYSLGVIHESVRIAALTIIDELCSLPPNFQAKVKLGSCHVEKHVTYDSSVVISLAQLFKSKRNAIPYDKNICSEILANDVYKPAKNKMGQLCLHFAVTLGWKAPQVSCYLFLPTLAVCPVDVTWPWVKQLLTTPCDDEVGDHVQYLCTILLRIGTWNVTSKTTSILKKDIIGVICDLLPHGDATKIRKILRGAFLHDLSNLVRPESIAPRWIAQFELSERQMLFRSIASEMVGDAESISRDDYVSSLQAIPVSMECAYDTLKVCQSKIANSLVSLDKFENGKANSEYVEEINSNTTGMALPLQLMCMYLDSISPTIQSADGASDYRHLSMSSVILMEILTSLNKAQFSTVLTIGYCRGLLLDLACTCLQKICNQIQMSNPLNHKTVKKTPQKKRKSAAVEVCMYSTDRINSDVEAVLRCLQLSATTYVQTYSLRLLEILLTLVPYSVEAAVQMLSEILATATSNKDNLSCDDSSGLVGGIIRTTAAIRSRQHENIDGTVISYPQEVLEPLFSNFSIMPYEKRFSLMKIALDEFDENCLPVSVTLCLSHSLAAHGRGVTTNKGSKVLKEANGTDNSDSGDVFILLSRSAQRKAHAARKVSLAEEHFSLATKVSLRQPAAVQMETLVVLTQMSKTLISFLLKDEMDVCGFGDESDEEEDVGNGKGNNMSEMIFHMDPFNDEAAKCNFSASKLIAYTNRLLQSQSQHQSSEKFDTDFTTNGAALVILFMEYILEHVENTKFHEAVLKICGEDFTDSGNSVQRLFLVLCEQLLELLAYSTHIQHSLAKSRLLFPIKLGDDDKIQIRPSAVAKRLWLLSLDIIHAIQRLLDGPTFIVILQELISHENMSVRQKSLQILGDRLKIVTGTKFVQQDSTLYLDLVSQLLHTVEQSVPEDMSAVHNANGQVATQELVSGQLGVAQSALLGIDILARQFASAKDWIEPMTQNLDALMSMVQNVNDAVQEFPLEAAITQEGFKLLGSFYLCCGTLCGVAKLRSLPYLEPLLGRILGLVEKEGNYLLQQEQSSDSGESADCRSQCRTLSLLIRSCVSTIAAIVSDLSSFFHPYLSRFLEAVTPLQTLKRIPDASLLSRDIEQCLYVITTKVPSRLSIPAIMQACLAVFTNKKEISKAVLHSTATKLAEFQCTNWEALDRTTVTSHLDTLQSISLVGMNYRYAQGDQSLGGDNVDKAVCKACIELCLKLTETELREFIVQLLDMKNNLLVSSDSSKEEKYSDWKIYSRSTVFFQLVSGLNSKLKHIFVPLMTLIWQGASDHLGTLIEFVNLVKPNVIVPDLSAKGKKGKKRKHVDLSSTFNGMACDIPTETQQKILKELITGCEWVLRSVRTCCANDNVNFVDQFQFESIVRQISGVYSLRSAFKSDSEYLSFVDEFVLPCMVELVIAVGKDILWKPLNRDILEMMRSHDKSVKIASLNALRKLFTDVGEEYLILLPECLPFLSEILEDSDSSVVALASNVIQSIEDMSGESLESYLR